MMPDRNQPSARRLGRAGIMVAVIVLTVIVLVFAERTLWHAKELEQEQQTGVNEHDGAQRATRKAEKPLRPDAKADDFGTSH
jgi:hypothetical protein